MLRKSVSMYLREHREELLSSYFKLLRFPSIANAPMAEGCGPCAEWIAGRLRGLGVRAEVLPTAGQPAVVGELHVDDSLPTLLAYAHYDVQPPDPLDLWRSPPFEPEIRDGRLYARGACDNKAGVILHLWAVEAYQRGGGLPMNLKVIFEGEEEVGSPHMEPFLAAHADRLAADALIITDGGFFDHDCPAICYALRGLCYFEVAFTGPDRDLHSGAAGGVVRNPIHALAAMIGALHDETGRVAIPGFYDDVRPLTDAERDEWARLPFTDEQEMRRHGVGVLAGGEAGRGTLERKWARPSLDCNGIWGGYTQAGSKTVLPSKASAKISMRLVGDQDPATIDAAFRKFVADHTPAGIRSEVSAFGLARPVLLDREQPAAEAVRGAFREAFGLETRMVRMGASIPTTELFQRILGLDGVVTGLGLPDSNIHAPNENLPVDHLLRGAEWMAAVYQLVSETSAPSGKPAK
jgi:acetylornithine deacetylase/succinyl-diaminopimelate desuccinylase-like protein